VEEIKASMPRPDKTFLFCHRFFTTSQLAVYLNPETKATSLNRRMSQYRLWFDPLLYRDWDAIFVDDNHYLKGSQRYLPLFTEVDSRPARIEILRKGQISHTLHVYRYYGFKGKFEEGE